MFYDGGSVLPLPLPGSAIAPVFLWASPPNFQPRTRCVRIFFISGLCPLDPPHVFCPEPHYVWGSTINPSRGSDPDPLLMRYFCGNDSASPPSTHHCGFAADPVLFGQSTLQHPYGLLTGPRSIRISGGGFCSRDPPPPTAPDPILLGALPLTPTVPPTCTCSIQGIFWWLVTQPHPRNAMLGICPESVFLRCSPPAKNTRRRSASDARPRKRDRTFFLK